MNTELKVKLLTGAGVATSLLALASVAKGATDTFSFVSLPDTALADISQYVPTAFTSLWVIIAVVIGLPVAFWVIRKVIGLFHFR